MRPKGHLGMRVSATRLTPKLVHMPHNAAQSVVVTVLASEAAASVSAVLYTCKLADHKGVVGTVFDFTYCMALCSHVLHKLLYVLWMRLHPCICCAADAECLS